MTIICQHSRFEVKATRKAVCYHVCMLNTHFGKTILYSFFFIICPNYLSFIFENVFIVIRRYLEEQLMKAIITLLHKRQSILKSSKLHTMNTRKYNY